MSVETPEIDDNTDDEILLALIKEDNQAAYRVIVDRYLGKLWRLGVNVLGNESEAEEVVQESLAQSHRYHNLLTIEEPGKKESKLPGKIVWRNV